MKSLSSSCDICPNMEKSSIITCTARVILSVTFIVVDLASKVQALDETVWTSFRTDSLEKTTTLVLLP